MKTLRGSHIEGDLLKLYNYYFAPDGGEEEAFQLAKAVGLSKKFKQLIKAQFVDTNAIFDCLLRNVITSPIVQYSEDAPAVFCMQDSPDLLLLRQIQTSIYEFELRIKVAVMNRASWQNPVGLRFATAKEAERRFFAGSNVSTLPLQADRMPVAFAEKENLRNETADTAKRVAIAIQQALDELRLVHAQNIVVKTNLDDYREITYKTNL